MSYLKAMEDGATYDVTSIIPTMTQKGFQAIRFVGEKVPETYTKGFMFFDDEDNLISDLSDYNDFYTENVYSVRKDVPVDPKPNNTSNSSAVGGGSSIAYELMDLRKKVEEMETYTETKKVYIHDTSVQFEVEKMGAVQAKLTVNDLTIPCSYSVDGNVITVTFEELEEVGEVTIYVIY